MELQRKNSKKIAMKQILIIELSYTYNRYINYFYYICDNNIYYIIDRINFIFYKILYNVNICKIYN